VKLSFSTLGCPDWSLAQTIDAAGRFGYDGIELRFLSGDDALWSRPELLGAGLAQTRARLRDLALGIACVDTRSFFHDPDRAARARAVEEAKRCLDLAAALGAPGIRVFGDRVQAGQDLPRTRGYIAEALEELGEAAAPLGVEVWIESHGDFARAPDTLRLLDGVSSPAVGVLWDAANAFEAGEEPEDGLRELGPRVRHVHLKDAARIAGLTPGAPWPPRLPGKGDFRPGRVFTCLTAAGYAGWVSFEWEKKWHPAIEAPEIALPHFASWASTTMRGETPADSPEGSSAPEHSITRGRLQVEVHADRPAVGRAAAAAVAHHLRTAIARDGGVSVIFASAPSQNELLQTLRGDRSISWDKVTAFHLDEFVGLDARHPASFRRFLVDRLFSHVPVGTFHGLRGEAPDATAECARYAALLAAHPPSLAILGIGENGHLAFIDPPMCDFEEPLDVRKVELDGPCRQQMVHDGAFARVEDVPRTALSLSIPFLMRVPRVMPIVPGPAKTAAVTAALEGPLTTSCPASILRRHPDARLFLDRASAAGLPMLA
jgi:glucosamine-6-phosphate deaminase